MARTPRCSSRRRYSFLAGRVGRAKSGSCGGTLPPASYRCARPTWPRCWGKYSDVCLRQHAWLRVLLVSHFHRTGTSGTGSPQYEPCLGNPVKVIPVAQRTVSDGVRARRTWSLRRDRKRIHHAGSRGGLAGQRHECRLYRPDRRRKTNTYLVFRRCTDSPRFRALNRYIQAPVPQVTTVRFSLHCGCCRRRGHHRCKMQTPHRCRIPVRWRFDSR